MMGVSISITVFEGVALSVIQKSKAVEDCFLLFDQTIDRPRSPAVCGERCTPQKQNYLSHVRHSRGNWAV